MFITFLGTGPSVGIPRKGHRDALCSDARQGGKSRRMRSAALVSSSHATILIDAGPDIALQLKRSKPRRIDAVLITHGHEDAIGGLKELDRWLGINSPVPPCSGTPSLNKGGRGLAAARLRESYIPVFTDRLTAERLITRFGRFQHLTFLPFKDYVPFEVKGLKITPALVLHTRDKRGIRTYGFCFEQFCYASDFYALPERTKNLFKSQKTLILDAAMYLGVKMPTHMGADETVRLAAELKAHRLILTQTGHTYPPHVQAEKAIRAYAHGLKSPFPQAVHLAYDGWRIKV